MDIDQVTERLVRELDRKYSHAGPIEAVRLADLIEDSIARELREAILQAIEQGDETARRTRRGFVFDGAAFDVEIGYRDIVRSGTLAVTLRETGPRTKPLVESIALGGIGKFKKVDLIFAPTLRSFAPISSQLTKVLYETGYAWLSEFLMSKVQGLESAMSTELFRQLRLAFADRPQLAAAVSLFVTDDKTGVYFFDQRAADAAITRINKQRGSVSQSAAGMFLGLLTSEVPYEQIFGRHSVETGEPLRIDFTKAEYLDSAPVVAIAEYVLNSNRLGAAQPVTVLALTRDTPPFLLCCFPTVYDSEIIPVLRGHTSQIQAAFNDHKSAARRFVKKLKEITDHSSIIGPVGELSGGIIKGLIGP